MPSVFDIYTFYLEAETLRGRSVVVHIERAEVEQVFNPRTKHDEPKIVVHFHGKKLALCCNKTQAGALVDITGTDDFTKWAGHSVTLTPARIDRERQTITITPAPAGNGNQQQAPAASGSTPAAGVDGEEGYNDPADEGEDTGI
ncbi:MAG: hypothetical protein U0X20_22030 [Caldilineaceae bacterium]